MAVLIAFDLDGVLYSSEAFVADAYREAIASVNDQRPGSFPRVPATREILAHIGWPVPTILARLFPAVDPIAVELLFVATLDVICRHVAAQHGSLYPDVTATLSALHSAGYRLAVASNGRRRYVETVLATYRLTELFLPLLTADQAGDKPSVLRAYAEREQVAPIATVMVGDRASDVEAAQAVGAHFIGCDFGHGSRAEIAAAGPIVTRFAEIPSAIAYVLH